MTMILEASVAARIASAIGSIPGCSMVTGDILDLRARKGGWGAEIRLNGWSPSLHGIHMRWEAVVGGATGANDQAGCAVDSIAPLLDTQRARAAAALALPCRPSAFPLDPRGNRFAVGHLHADASALAIHIGDDDHRYVRSPRPTPEQKERQRAVLLETPALDRMHALSGFVADLHSATRDHDGGGSLRTKDVAVSERRGVRTFDWAQLVRTPGVGSGSGQGFLRGATLTIGRGDVPATIAEALIGRPVRDLVDIHPMVSPRIIRRVRTLASGEISVTLAPAQVAIEDVRTMTVGQALEHLRGVVAG